jgi:phage baseplate assembly protein V
MIRIAKKVVEPIQRRVRLMVGRAVIALVNDAARVQSVQVTLLEGETRDEVERFQEYGFSSVPLPGAEAVMVCVSGNRDHGIVVAVEDRRYRLKDLGPGDAALYDHRGAKIHLSETGILIEAAGQNVEITGAPQVNIASGTVNVTGGDVVADGISLKTHTHGGVQPGSGSTGVPQ